MIQSGVLVWRNVVGFVSDIHISNNKLDKGDVLGTYVISS